MACSRHDLEPAPSDACSDDLGRFRGAVAVEVGGDDQRRRRDAVQLGVERRGVERRHRRARVAVTVRVGGRLAADQQTLFQLRRRFSVDIGGVAVERRAKLRVVALDHLHPLPVPVRRGAADST